MRFRFGTINSFFAEEGAPLPVLEINLQIKMLSSRKCSKIEAIFCSFRREWAKQSGQI